MSKWVGYAVSVSCGEPLGCYQGTILQADGSTITLTKAFRNGFPYPKSQVTINAADIKELKIIEESRPERGEKTHSTVAVTKSNKKAQRATVCENLQANNTNTGNQQNVNVSSNNVKAVAGRSNTQAPVRSKPIDIQGPRNKNNTHTGSFGNAGSTPKARACGEKARRRNEACFGDAAEPAIDDDFDFEGNLALFDKQALWEEMRARPDVVRGADEARLALRPDEPVLPPAAPAPAHLRLPEELRAPPVYSADDGRRLPAASEGARRRLWEGLVRYGVADAALVLLARAAADVALRLAGGGRRLEARNAHQAPVAVALAAPHRAGAAAVLAARLLASHGVGAHVLLAGDAHRAARCGPLQRELAAFALGGVPAVSHAQHLPPAPDLVLLGLHDPLNDTDEDEEEGSCEAVQQALEWARGARGALVALEPPARGWPGLWCRASLVGGLPGALVPALGQQFLADVAPPPALFRDLRVAYRPPFGAASVLPLH